jgi:hypothetical protein
MGAGEVNITVEIDLDDISNGMHFFEFMALSKSGIWSVVSRFSVCSWKPSTCSHQPVASSQ